MPSTRPPVRGQTLASRLIQRIADGEARRQGFRAGDARRREVDSNRSADTWENRARYRPGTDEDRRARRSLGQTARRSAASAGRTADSAARRSRAAARR